MGSNSLPLRVGDVLERLRNADLVGVFVDSARFTMRLEFTFGPAKRDVTVEMANLVHCAIARTIDDEPLCAFVAVITLRQLDDGGMASLTTLGFPFREQTGTVRSFPGVPLVHLHMEGGVCIDAVASRIQVFEEVT